MTGMLDGKSLLVTGGGNGIGRAAALIFAREGARLVVADFDPEAAATTVGQINAAGGQAISIGGDVTKSADVAAMTTAAVASFGRLDGAFNNAGVAPHQVGSLLRKTHEWSEQSFARMIEVNLTSVWLCMKHEIGHMLASGGGAIVNTASIAGLIGLANATAYVAAKHGVIGLTKTAAMEYAEQGIRVNAVCPGFIETRMTKLAVARRGDQLKANTPLGRLGQPEEIGSRELRDGRGLRGGWGVDGGVRSAEAGSNAFGMAVSNFVLACPCRGADRGFTRSRSCRTIRDRGSHRRWPYSMTLTRQSVRTEDGQMTSNTAAGSIVSASSSGTRQITLASGSSGSRHVYRW